MIVDLIGPAVSILVVVAAGIFSLKGTRTTDSTDRLSKAAGLYSDYADKMEKRLTAVEEKNKELQADQVAMNKRQEKSEKLAELYRREAGDYKRLVLEVIQWITELIDWELRDYKGTAPRTTLNMVLAHLTDFMKSRNFEIPEEKTRGESDAD